MMPRMTSSVCNVIFMRMISLSLKNTPLRFERCYLPFSSRQRGSHLAQCSASTPPSFDTATVCAVGMRVCVSSSSFFSAFSIMASSFSTWSGGISWIFHLWRAVFFFLNIPLLLSFLLSTFGHRRPHFWPNPFWSRCDLRFGQSAIRPRITLEWTFVQDAESPIFRNK